MSEIQERGEKLTYTEFVAFVKWVNRFPSKVMAAQALGVSRPTLDSILDKGRSKKNIIEKVRTEISELA